jgi:hypothetical protein
LTRISVTGCVVTKEELESIADEDERRKTEAQTSATDREETSR